MSVNLCAQEGEEPRDVVLHFDVRFHRDNIISLSRKNGVWIGSGNYDTNYNMFVPGTIFRIIFEIKDTDVITIYCQGKFHSNFLPKIPLSMARYIVAWADVEKITHCFFYLGKRGGNELPTNSSTYGPPSPRNAPGGDIKRRTSEALRSRSKCVAVREQYRRNPNLEAITPSLQNSPRSNKKQVPGSHRGYYSNDSSDEDTVGKNRIKAEGQADRAFYETLMCQQHQKFRVESPGRFEAPNRAEYSKKYLNDNSSSEKNTEDYSEDVSKHDISSPKTEDMLPEVNKRARGKFSAQVMNLVGKSVRKK